MDHAFKRALSFLMALVMVLSLMPSIGHVHAHAEEVEHEDHAATEPAVEPQAAPAETEAESELDLLIPNWENMAEEEILAELDRIESEESQIMPMATLTGLSDTTIGLSGTASRWTVGTNSLNGSVTGSKVLSYYLSATETLTITNKKDSAALLSFDFTASGNFAVDSTVTVDGTEYTAATTSSFSKELAAGGSITIKLTADRCNASNGANTISIAISNLNLTAVGVNPTVTFKAPSNGSYTVNGTDITADTAMTNPSTTSYTMVATAASGYKLVGWYNETLAKYVSTAATYTAQFEANTTIYPVFAASNAAIFQVGTAVDGQFFYDLDDAVNYATANSKTQITLISSGTISDASYTIPAGITLLIPKDSEYTPMGAAPASTNDYTTPSAFVTLTLAANTTITVNGTIEAEATHTVISGGSERPYGGRPAGKYGAIYMNSGSNITVNSGAVLYAWGYVYGSGSVTINSGAQVHESMQVTDFPGGSNLSGFVDTAQDTDADGDGNAANDYIKSFPMSQYYVQNVEVPMTLYAGATEYIYATIYAASQSIGMPVEFIGTNGMFIPSSGYIVKDYLESKDRLVVDIYGDAALSSIILDMSETKYAATLRLLIGTDKFDSASYILGLNSNITINVKSGVTTVQQDVALFPGVEIYIDSGAALSVAACDPAGLTLYGSGGHNVYAYDLDQWGNFVFSNQKLMAATYSPTSGRYKRTAADLKDVIIDVNGTIISNGYLYSTVAFDDNFVPVSGGASIISSGKTGTIVMNYGAGIEEFAYALDGTSSADNVVTIDSVWLKNGDGSFLLTDGATAETVYNYCATHDMWYTGSCDKCAAATQKFTITWMNGTEEIYNEEVDAGTVPSYNDENPTKASDATNHYTFAGWSLTEGGSAVTSFEAVSGNVTYYAVYTVEAHADATKDHKCDTCSYVMSTCSDGSDKDHNCDTCGKENISGHSYTSVVTKPTCNEQGYTTYTCACGDSYVADYVDATGHDMQETTAAVAPTCETAGSTAVLTCANGCGKTEGGEEIAATGHDMQETTAAVAPGCETAGSTAVLTCANGCGKTEGGAEIPATGHDWALISYGWDLDAGEESCVAYGECKNCDATTEANAKEIKVEEVDPATCTNGAYLIYTAVFEEDWAGTAETDEYGEPLGHTPAAAVTENEVAADCDTDGSYDTVVYCSVCGDELSRVTETVPATGHDMQETTAAVAPTCETAGYTAVLTCANGCGKTEGGAEIPATGHDMQETTAAVAPTCETAGSTAVYTCANGCGKTEGGEEIAATGHDMQETTAAVAPTCETAGSTAVYTCANGCGKTEGGEVIPATGHDYEAVVTKPTCTEQGYTTYTCACGDSYVADYVDATGHDMQETTAAVAPTCETAGSTAVLACANGCGKTEGGEEIAALGHDMQETTAAVAPTCETAGSTAVLTCANGCGKTEGGEVIPATGHSYVESAADWYVVGEDHYYGTISVCENDEAHVAYNPVTGIARVPYPAEGINGITYAPDQETLDYCESKGETFIDAENAWFVFGEDGKFQSTTGIVDGSKYAVNGMLSWHPGLVLIGENYYYFIGDEEIGGNIMATGDVYILRNTTDREVVISGVYTFGEDGVLCEYDGIETVNGTLRYYEDAQLMLGNGLTKVGDNYIYVRHNGELVVSNEYYVPANDLDVIPGTYTFDENGFLVQPELTDKDGVYFENGFWYYYENGAIACNKGLISVTEKWVNGDVVETYTGVIYVRSNGQLATGEYWITNVANYTGTDAAYGDKVTFNDKGLMEAAKNGIVDGMFYVDGKVAYNLGLIEYNGGYIYVRSNGEVVMNQNYWITNVGDTGIVAKLYTFDENGFLQNPEFVKDQLNGIVDVDGKLYFYENGSIVYGAGLMEYNGGYIYVRSTGELAVGKYWVTNTNDLMKAGMYTFGENGMMII